jgi:HEAT repeat protein
MMSHTFAASRALGIFVGVFVGVGIACGQSNQTPRDDAREAAEQIRAALSGKKGTIGQQRSALTLVIEAFRNFDTTTFLEEEQELAAEFRKTLSAYQPPANDPTTTALWLEAYGSVLPTAQELVDRVGPYLPEKPRHPPIVTRAAAAAVGMVIDNGARRLQRPPLLSEAQAHLQGQRPLAAQVGDLLQLAANACGYSDEETRRRGLRAIETVANAVQQRFLSAFLPEKRTEIETPAEAQLIADFLRETLLPRLAQIAPALKSGLSSADPFTRLQAARTASEIALMGERFRNLLSFAGRAPAKGEATPGGKYIDVIRGVLPDVIQRLRDPLPGVRLAAAETAESAGPRAWPFRAELAAAAQDRDPIVRWVIARALGRILPEDSSDAAVPVAALVGQVHDPDIDVRTNALRSLQRYGSRAVGAIDAVIENINRGDVDVRVVAVDTLEWIVAEGAKTSDVERAVAALADGVRTGDPRVQRQAADALGRLGPAAKSALPVLREAERDPEPDLRRKASKAILFIDR